MVLCLRNKKWRPGQEEGEVISKVVNVILVLGGSVTRVSNPIATQMDRESTFCESNEEMRINQRTLEEEESVAIFAKFNVPIIKLNPRIGINVNSPAADLAARSLVQKGRNSVARVVAKNSADIRWKLFNSPA